MPTFIGTNTDDSLSGGSGSDFVDGRLGADTLFGLEGGDVLQGLAGDDTLDGGAGADSLTGGAGDDTFHADGDDVRIVGGSGYDTVFYGNGADIVSGVIDLVAEQFQLGGGNDVFAPVSATIWSDVALGLGELDGSNGVRIDGDASGDQAGSSVAALGDINGDGYGDYAVGAPGYGSGDAGASYVVFGTAAGLPAALSLDTPDGSGFFRVTGADAGALSGTSVQAAGDVNGDGIDDFVIGAPGADGGAGAAYVVFGHGGGWTPGLDVSTLDGTDGFRIDGASAGDAAGAAVSSAGDVNGDGYDDLIIGATGLGGGDGGAYILFGQTSWSATFDLAAIDGDNGVRLTGDTDDVAGTSVASAGDVNGDGYDDVLIGTPGAGHVYLVFGAESAHWSLTPVLALPAMTVLDGQRLTSDGTSEMVVAGGGDINGDGYDDFVIGERGANGAAGTAYVIFGHGGERSVDLLLTVLDGNDGVAFEGAVPGEQIGYSVAFGGDINGDGYDDLLIGAPGDDPEGGAGAGHAYVIYGQRQWFDTFGSVSLAALTTFTGLRLDGVASGDDVGVAVSSAGDVNGDGYEDFLVGAGGLGGAGGAYLVLGGFQYGLGAAGSIFVVQGQAGDDTIVGLGANDTLTGGEGADSLYGGDGDDLFDEAPDGVVDTLNGGYGNDFYRLRDPSDVVDEFSAGTAGFDTVWVSFTDYTLAPGVEVGAVNFAGPAILTGEDDVNFLFGDIFADTIYGVGGHDRIFGGEGADTLYGGSGDDFLHASVGNDTLIGGIGNDHYRIDDPGADLVVEGAGAGTDQVWVAFSGYTLDPNVEWGIINLEDDTPGDMTGNGSDNTLYGTDGVNTLRGAGGLDNLLGYAGVDVLFGDDGNDVLQGGLDQDTLFGGDGNDVFIGGGGTANTYFGGAGDDFYRVDAIGDVVDETGGSGVDTVWISVGTNYTATAGVEAFAVNAYHAMDITGNALDNLIQGNDAANTLLGGDGNDLLYGYDDVDSLAGQNGLDTLFGGNGDDFLSGGASADWLVAGAGNDSLDGGTGADTLRGGDGNDWLDVGAGDGAADTIGFGPGAGTDTVSGFGHGQDRIEVIGHGTSFGALSITSINAGADSQIVLPDGTTIVVLGYGGGWAAGDFIFT